MLAPSTFCLHLCALGPCLQTVLVKGLNREWEVLGVSFSLLMGNAFPFSEVRRLRTSWHTFCLFLHLRTGDHPSLDRFCVLEASFHGRISGVLH